MKITERVLHKLYLLTRKYRFSKNQNALKRKDFTIISNNCWGGMTSEVYGLQKSSPTVGCYFYADDYLKFIEHLAHYISLDLAFISADEAKHKDWIYDDGSEKYPIGQLGDIEIIFLHYPNKEIAKEKWDRRCKRINWDNLVFKFSHQNHFTYQDLERFDKMSLPGKKILFVNNPMPELSCALYYPGYEDKDYLLNDTFWGHRYFDVSKFLNEGIIVPRNKTWASILFKHI